MKKILVVDDEKAIADIVQFNLEKKVMKYTWLMMEEAIKRTYDIARSDIVDIMMPKRWISSIKRD